MAELNEILNGTVDEEPETLEGSIEGDESVGGEIGEEQFDFSGTNNHALLFNRNAPGAHSMGAIEGLQEELARLADNEEMQSAIAEIMGLLAAKADELEVDEEGLVYLLSNGERINGPYGPFAGNGSGGGGGGGGSSNNAVLTVTNRSGWLSTTISSGSSLAILLNWTSLEDELSTGSGTVTVYVNGTNKASINVPQGDISIDVTNYLSAGRNTVRLRVSDAYGNI